MIRHVALAALILAVAGSLSDADAQGRGHGKNKHKGKHKNKHQVSQGIPPGHLPGAGECRVWYEGRPPGHQPAPTSCTEARAIAAGDSDARVIYGDRDRRRDDRDDRIDHDDDDDRDKNRRADDRRDGVLGGILGDRNDRERRDRDRIDRERREREAESRRPRSRTVPRDERQVGDDHAAPFRNGHNDGYREGLTDGRSGVPASPSRFSKYRAATRGYRTTFGSRAQYQERYREGFRAGYEKGYGESSGRD